MYQITISNEGYTFRIPNGNTYLLYLTQPPLFNEVSFSFKSTLTKDKFYYLGFSPIIIVNNRNSFFTKRAIAHIVFDFFTENRDAVLVFNYSTEDGKIQARRRLFKKWIMEYSEFSSIQFYQHDYSDEVSVCALYFRSGADKFYLLKDDIENFLSKTSDQIGINKD